MTKTQEPIHFDIVVRSLEDAIKWNTKELTKFKEAFADDPLYAFEWGERAVAAAATIKVLTVAIKLLNAGADVSSPGERVQATYTYAVNAALRGARQDRQSTSAMANIAHAAETAAWAKLVEDSLQFYANREVV